MTASLGRPRRISYLGGAVAAWGAGVLHDVTGGYRLSFIIAGIACLVAAAGVLRIRRDPEIPTFQPTPPRVPART